MLQQVPSRRKQDHLVNLIQSLNANEKRYFKMFNSLQKGNKKYDILFNALSGLNDYNVPLLCNKLSISKKQLSDDKQYLQQVLLKSLRNASATDARTPVRHTMEDIFLMRKKGLHAMAVDLAERAIPIALENEQFEIAIELYQAKYSSLMDMNEWTDFSELPVIIKNLTDKINEFTVIRSLYHSLAIARVSNKNILNETGKRIFSNPLFRKRPESLKSFWAQRFWYMLHSEYYLFVEHNVPIALKYMKKQLAFFEADSRARKLATDGIYICLSGIAYLERERGDYDLALDYLAQMEEQLRLDEKLNGATSVIILFKQICVELKMLILINAKRYSIALSICKEAVAHIKQFRENRRQSLYYKYAVCLLHTGNFSDSVIMLNKMLTGVSTELPETQLHARLFMAMNFIGQGNFSLLPYHITTTKAWLKRQKIKDPEADLLLKCLTAFKNYSTKANAISDLQKAIDNGKLSRLNFLLDLRGWINLLR